MGDDIPFVPNKRTGGICIGAKIAPIFFNTMEDSGAPPHTHLVPRIYFVVTRLANVESVPRSQALYWCTGPM